jgi:segregation and condensation protein B
MSQNKLKNALEAILLSAERPLKLNQLAAIFEEDTDKPERDELRKALLELEEDYEPRGFELKKVASGYRIQVKQDHALWVSRLWDEKPARYTRALLETMALIAYRQPVTRGEIEEVRGVSVSSNTIRTMLERDWIRVLGHKDVPGKPALYGTTKEFLDYFNLKSLDELPTLAEIKDFDKVNPQLTLDDVIDENMPADVSVGDSVDDQSSDDTVEQNELVEKSIKEASDEFHELEESESSSSAAGI